MKILYFIVLLLPLITQCLPAKTLDVDLDDPARIKRSGGADLFAGLHKTILSGIGRASASFVAGSSGTSSSSSSSHSSHSSTHPAETPHHHEEPHHFDGWQLKKSILNTLFQAVKAITGGVTTLKGQLIKGSGYLVSGTGKLIMGSGDAVTGVGKKIVSSAKLSPPSHYGFAKLSGPLSSSSSGSSSSHSSASSSSHHPSPHPGHSESFTSFEAPTSHGHDYHSHTYTAPSAPAGHHEEYLPPKTSSHSVSYKSPLSTYGAPLEVYSTGPAFLPTPSKSHTVVQASDVLRQILNQKIPTPDKHEHHSYTQYEIPHDALPPFKPIKNYLPSNSNLYKIPVGPLESVTHSHSITTAFGSPLFPNNELQVPNAYEVYRHMATKNGAGDHKISYSLEPPKETEAYHTNSLHDEHLRQLGHQLGLGQGIEIQKSVTYELTDPNTTQHKKRSNNEQSSVVEP